MKKILAALGMLLVLTFTTSCSLKPQDEVDDDDDDGKTSIEDRIRISGTDSVPSISVDEKEIARQGHLACVIELENSVIRFRYCPTGIAVLVESVENASSKKSAVHCPIGS